MSFIFKKTILLSIVAMFLFLWSPIPSIITRSNNVFAQDDSLTQTADIPCYDEDEDGYALKVFPKSPIKWFVCAIGQIFAEGIDFLNTMTQRLLLFDPTKTDSEAETFYADCVAQTDDDSCAGSAGLQGDGPNQLRKLWGNILTISNILLVIAFLVMIVSTALDLGVFSNYTVKKMLPRIIIAAFAANLSWSICALIISMINFVGIGLQQFLTAPFAADLNANLGTAIQASTAPDAAVGVKGGVMAGIGVLMYLIMSSGGSLLLVFGSVGLLAALVAMLVVLLRRIILILLIVFSPLAFMMWAFPGGEKMFQKWWKTFSTMMLVYPFAMALFSGGIIVATIMSSSGGLNITGGTGGAAGGVESLITGVVIFASLIAPYALLPTTFKLAGGVIGNVANIANDKSKGLVDRAKNSGGYKKKAERKKEKDDARAAKRGFVRAGRKSEEGKNAAGRFVARRRQAQAYGRRVGPGSGFNKALAAEAVSKHEGQAVAVEKMQLAQETAGMTHPEKLKHVEKKGREAATKGKASVVRAAADTLVDNKATQNLQNLQDHVVSMTPLTPMGSQNQRVAATAVDTQVGERYGEVKAFGAHLTASTKSSANTVRANTGELNQQRVENFLQAPTEVQAANNYETWQSVNQMAASTTHTQAPVQAAQRTVVKTEKLRGSLDNRMYTTDPVTGDATPAPIPPP